MALNLVIAGLQDKLMKAATTYSDDYYHHIDEDSDTAAGGESSISWAELELEPVTEDQEPSFSDTLSERNRDAFKHLAVAESRNVDEIGFKAMANRYKQEYQQFADSSGVGYEVELEPRGVAVNLIKLEKVMGCFTDAIFVHECLSALVVGGHVEGSSYIIRLTGYLSADCRRKPRKISDALVEKASAAGMEVSWNFQANQKVEYKICAPLCNK